jgi:outer membrane receptor for ferrienterochelin and colicin
MKVNHFQGFLALIINIFFSASLIQAQTVNGRILENDGDPVPGVSLKWLEDQIGTQTDDDGFFKLPYPAQFPARMVINLIGYRTDTLTYSEIKDSLILTIRRNAEMRPVEIVARQRATIISSVETQKVELLTQKEFTKAACCNLSESFETNATVDVSYADAVTGIKEVQMLGLAGIYTQITKGNQPLVRGLGRMMGLNYIPGTWVNSVQVAKGTGSVVNGYESIAGQINVEYLEPFTMKDKWLFNVYGNSLGRTEANVVSKLYSNDKWATAIFLHTSTLQQKIDRNKDGFLDLPKYLQLNLANYWKYDSKKGFEAQFGFQFVDDNVEGGQLQFNPKTDKLTAKSYGLGIRMSQIELFSKTGYVFKGKKYKSVGLQMMGVWHKQDSYFGIRPYIGEEHNFNANLIYQTKFIKEVHTFKAGASYMYDRFQERVDSNGHFQRTESVPGIFSEITLKKGSRMTIVGGLRLDAHNLYGAFVTPRLHFKYNLTEKLTLRVGGGRGYRVVNLYPENLNLLTSSRKIIRDKDFRPEIAWNYGLSLTQKTEFWMESGTISLDLYRTDFQNQIVVDMDNDQMHTHVYNLRGVSYANTLQLQWNQSWFTGFETRLAYKFYDVRTDFEVGRLEKALVARHRIFVNLAYEIGRFSFDLTYNLFGPKRLPRTDMNPEHLRLPAYSPAYAIVNAQISYKVKDWDFYIGGENIGNFRQSNPILSANDPFSPHFDTSFVWGPIVGSIYYVGIRFRIPDKLVCPD